MPKKSTTQRKNDIKSNLSHFLCVSVVSCRCKNEHFEENQFKFRQLPRIILNFEPFGRRIANEFKSQI